ncbi:MAG: carbohydrate binding family 9 domain-containing protein, partial [bacterium]|nr:carbohydrate binding family 9 domain-containing protein [bacterium]
IAEDAWKNALMLELKYEVEPGENIPAPVKTEFFITYSKSHLYAAFRCYDPNSSQIRAHLSDRDNDYGDDFVGIALDTFNDERKNFILWSNPRGVQEDAVMIRNVEYDTSWDARYKSVGKIFDWGYSVEMAVPFSSLRFQRGNGSQVWGIDAWRNYPRNVRHQLGLFPRDRNNNCYQCQMVKIRGFEGIKPGRNLEVTPTLTAVRTDAREE